MHLAFLNTLLQKHNYAVDIIFVLFKSTTYSLTH